MFYVAHAIWARLPVRPPPALADGWKAVSTALRRRHMQNTLPPALERARPLPGQRAEPRVDGQLSHSPPATSLVTPLVTTLNQSSESAGGGRAERRGQTIYVQKNRRRPSRHKPPPQPTTYAAPHAAVNRRGGRCRRQWPCPYARPPVHRSAVLVASQAAKPLPLRVLHSSHAPVGRRHPPTDDRRQQGTCAVGTPPRRALPQSAQPRRLACGRRHRDTDAPG